MCPEQTPLQEQQAGEELMADSLWCLELPLRHADRLCEPAFPHFNAFITLR